MAEVLSDRSSGVLSALTEKSEQFAADITRAADQALSEISDQGLAFTRTVAKNGA
jgi:hypothetical protein